MMIPPFLGPPGDTAVAPDPIIYWFVVPVLAYLWAWWAGAVLSRVVRTDREEKRDE